PADPRQFRPDLPAEIVTILSRLLAKNPARRYQLPSELIADLSAVVYEGSSPRYRVDSSFARALAVGQPVAWRRHVPWLVPVVALLIIVGGVAIYDFVHERAMPAAPLEPRPGGEPAASAMGSAPDTQNAPPVVPRGEPSLSRDAVFPDDNHAEPAAVAAGSKASADGPANPSEVDLTQWFNQSSWRRKSANVFGQLIQAIGQQQPAPGSTVEQPKMSAANVTNPNVARPDAAAGNANAAATGNARLQAPGKVLVVATNRQDQGVFASLQAAVSAAASGDVVELDFDGRHEERPLELANKDLTLRAAEGRRPVLVFRPSDADVVGYSRSMMIVAGGSLVLSGLEIELEMPRKISADSWALFEIRRAERLRLERTTLTIRNGGMHQTPLHSAVAFFDLKTPPGSDTMAVGSTVPPLVELVDCVVRGEAACLRTNELEPVRLDWSNGLLATSESLLLARASGGRSRASGSVEIELRRVTAIVHNGLARVSNNEDAPYLMDTTIRCTASVVVADPGAPLVEERGVDTAGQFRDRFAWSASHSDFEGLDLVVWRIVHMPSGETFDMDFATWHDYWGAEHEVDCRRGALPWMAKAAAKKRLSELSPADLVGPSDAVEATGADVGGDRALLPIPSPMETPGGVGPETSPAR
ncbi:MAG TPA: hypothetical protein VMF30_19095, partial [Pirellulales bacterium]|nr:hypothetical protein [Pirellulales bacterium]